MCPLNGYKSNSEKKEYLSKGVTNRVIMFSDIKNNYHFALKIENHLSDDLKNVLSDDRFVLADDYDINEISPENTVDICGIPIIYFENQEKFLDNVLI